MKINIVIIFICLLFKLGVSQNTGDTIVVKAFKYGSMSRDTVISFPNNQTTFEKILLKYNMRCKNGLISTQSQPDQGCGEWDYSCNTFLVDSSKTETKLAYAPSHIISNFSGTVFPYVTQPIYDYYNYLQQQVTLSNINSENQYTLSAGNFSITNFLKTDMFSGRSQVLFTASELIAAGFTAGLIDGIMLDVLNTGATANFLKIGIKHTLLNSLTNSIIQTTGFTNVYNYKNTFNNGTNRLQFHTSFNWDGTSNIIFDFSFTNSVPSSSLILNGSSTPSVMTITKNNNFSADLSNYGLVNITTPSLASINNEITVSFWSYGYSNFLPTYNTSIIHGDQSGNRNLNVHLPWSNSTIYFDCGFAGGTFDRINKLALAANFSGQWNHWTFTKNSISGMMKIYLNGNLWHSASGKTKPITLLNLILGNDLVNDYNYKGKANELTIWNKELSASTIQQWMNKPIDSNHPDYSNLVAYYKMNEGVGQSILDVKNNISKTGTNIQWRFDRGDALTYSFQENLLRPTIKLLRGNYSISTTSVTATDSVAHGIKTIKTYSITSTATVTPPTHDLITLVSTQNVYEALPRKIFNGDQMIVTGTLNTIPQASVTITQLPYYKRNPYYAELMSFVTPYGKGLDLGLKGKSWFFDITDFSPLLKGNKRLLMNGGAYQEQMDIDFLCIVGTPPKNVLRIDPLWQGSHEASSASIQEINTNARFAPVVIPISSAGKSFKLRSTITGHGAEGEFHQNGGLVQHYFNIDGGGNEFSWQLTKYCGMNPIYPQGGTWIYDRQGWCPGEYSLTKEFDMSPYLVAGGTHTLDYNCSNPPSPNGTYAYLVSHQLVSYGSPNHALDVRINEVLAPSNRIEFSRKNPICANPKILVQNSGSLTVNSVQLEYWLNNTTTKQMYTWNGNLAFMDTASITLPIQELWINDLKNSDNIFKVNITKVNNVIDDYPFNNHYFSPFQIPATITNSFSIEYKTNNYPLDNEYILYDDQMNIVSTSATFTTPNTTYQTNHVLSGCYKLVMKDLGNDGLAWWANSAQGSGAIFIKDFMGNYVHNFNPDFGGGFEFNFTAGSPLSLEELASGLNVNVYPNPAHNKCYLSGYIVRNSKINIYDQLGKLVYTRSTGDSAIETIDLTGNSKGFYVIKIENGSGAIFRKLVIE